MTIRSRLTTILVLVALAAMLLIATAGPALAQDSGTPQETAAGSTDQGPAGEATLVWFVGIGAVLVVGAAALLQEHFRLPPPPDLDKSNH